jgi:amino-acid N-acetyltransferase
MIRKAQIDEVPEIRKILLAFSSKWDILPRTLAELYNSVRDYYVYREPHGHIQGVVALHIFWEDLGEIRSLAVAPECQKKGLGARLVHRCLEEARELGLKRVFVLTSKIDYFKRFGFQEVPKDELPRIIWAECKECVKFPDCDEVPMQLMLGDDLKK